MRTLSLISDAIDAVSIARASIDRARASASVRAVSLCVAAASSAMLAGCATTKAAAVIAGPPLAVSPPPPRVIMPFEDEPLAATGKGLDTPLLTLPRVPQQTPPPRRPVPARADAEPRTETASTAAAPVVGPSPSAEAPRELRAVPSAAAPAIDHQVVQGNIDRANGLLRGMDQNKLNNDAKSSFEEARKFVTIAVQKLKERNVGAAAEAADKALKLAQALTGH